MKSAVDVLIVGAGPVGLLLAAELSRDGVEVLLIDRLIRRSYFCKALGITPRTLEIFDDLGFVQDAIDAGVWLRGVSSFDDGVPGPTMDYRLTWGTAAYPWRNSIPSGCWRTVYTDTVGKYLTVTASPVSRNAPTASAHKSQMVRGLCTRSSADGWSAATVRIAKFARHLGSSSRADNIRRPSFSPTWR